MIPVRSYLRNPSTDLPQILIGNNSRTFVHWNVFSLDKKLSFVGIDFYTESLSFKQSWIQKLVNNKFRMALA